MGLSLSRAREIIKRCHHLAAVGLLTAQDAEDIIRRLGPLADHSPGAGFVPDRDRSRMAYRS